jgi:hypothetical protein
MAIQKSYDSGFGVSFPTAYWCINGVRMEKVARNVVVEVTIFADVNAKENGFDPVGSQVFRLQQSDYLSVVEAGFPAIYNALKAAHIQGGTDV